MVDTTGQLPGKAPNGYTRSLCVLDIAEDDTYDHRLANYTIAGLRLAKQQKRAFALFAGHRRPHGESCSTPLHTYHILSVTVHGHLTGMINLMSS